MDALTRAAEALEPRSATPVPWQHCSQDPPDSNVLLVELSRQLHHVAAIDVEAGQAGAALRMEEAHAVCACQLVPCLAAWLLWKMINRPPFPAASAHAPVKATAGRPGW